MIKEKVSIKGKMNRGTVYGIENFIRAMVKEYKIEVVIKPTGRLKKEENEGKTKPFPFSRF